MRKRTLAIALLGGAATAAATVQAVGMTWRTMDAIHRLRADLSAYALRTKQSCVARAGSIAAANSLLDFMPNEGMTPVGQRKRGRTDVPYYVLRTAPAGEPGTFYVVLESPDWLLLKLLRRGRAISDGWFEVTPADLTPEIAELIPPMPTCYDWSDIPTSTVAYKVDVGLEADTLRVLQEQVARYSKRQARTTNSSDDAFGTARAAGVEPEESSRPN